MKIGERLAHLEARDGTTKPDRFAADAAEFLKGVARLVAAFRASGLQHPSEAECASIRVRLDAVVNNLRLERQGHDA
jgi:hypothetical protein